MEEYEEEGTLKALMGYTIMSLYTYIPPLRNDFGCVMLVHEEPMDKKRNYYWVERGAFYLNHFKTMKRYPEEPPIIFPPVLKKVVTEWIKKSKAKVYLFSKQNNDAYAGCLNDNKANSFSNLMYNLFGFFPSPLVYGLANTIIGGGKKNSRWGMRIIMYSISLIFVFIIFAICKDKNTNYKNICNKKNESEKEDDNYVRLQEDKIGRIKVEKEDD